jgi:hypothetical protein
MSDICSLNFIPFRKEKIDKKTINADSAKTALKDGGKDIKKTDVGKMDIIFIQDGIL